MRRRPRPGTHAFPLFSTFRLAIIAITAARNFCLGTADRPAAPADGLVRQVRTSPNGLREAGIDVVALAERYGVPADERITDIRWMREAAEHGEAVLMCDDAIRKKNPEERRVLVEVKLRAFVVNSQLPAADVVRRFLANLPAIERACRRPGPFVYRVHPDRIELRQIRM